VSIDGGALRSCAERFGRISPFLFAGALRAFARERRCVAADASPGIAQEEAARARSIAFACGKTLVSCETRIMLAATCQRG